jgi:hypothetical protein
MDGQVVASRLAAGDAWLETFAACTLHYQQQPSQERVLERFRWGECARVLDRTRCRGLPLVDVFSVDCLCRAKSSICTHPRGLSASLPGTS